MGLVGKSGAKISLINQVLKDLDQRRAETDGARLPRDVRPLPAVESRRGPLIVAGALLAGVLAAGAWAWQAFGPGRPLPAVTGLPAQAALNTAMPPLAVPMPDPAPAPTGQMPADGAVLMAPLTRSDSLPSLRLSPELRVVPAAKGEGSRRQGPPGVTPGSESAVPDPGHRPDPAPAPALSLAPAVSPPVRELPESSPGVIEKQPVLSTPQESAERLYRSALAQINLGRTDDGLTTLRAALREHPAHVAARQTLVRMYVDSRSWEAAVGVLRDGLEIRPEQFAWAMLLSRLLAERGDNAGAYRTLEKHEAAGRGNASYLAGMAAVLQRLDRQADAAVRYDQAARLEPANGRWWLGLATANEALGRSAEARDAYQRAAAARNLPEDLQAYAEGKLK